LRNNQLISQAAINLLLLDDITNDLTEYTPLKLRPTAPLPINYDHYVMSMFHPITGELITSYRCLMKDPITAKTWMTAFGKDFGGMCQSNTKTGQKGTNALFVMPPKVIPNIPKDRMVTYAWITVDHFPQMEDPNRIQITAGGYLINSLGKLTMHQTANTTTSKLHWNTVLSTQKAKYMCLDIKKNYLSTPINRTEYM
jgi:hypothetical protein